MNTLPPTAPPSTAELDAARLLLARMGLSAPATARRVEGVGAQGVSPTLMNHLQHHADERAAPPDGQLLR